jgi:hypothetical protein
VSSVSHSGVSRSPLIPNRFISRSFLILDGFISRSLLILNSFIYRSLFECLTGRNRRRRKPKELRVGAVSPLKKKRFSKVSASNVFTIESQSVDSRTLVEAITRRELIVLYSSLEKELLPQRGFDHLHNRIIASRIIEKKKTSTH